MQRRAVPRKTVLMSGAIQFAGGAVNCLVRDMSISGAALDVTEPHDIPERFNLVFKVDGTQFPVASSGAITSGSALPSTNPRGSLKRRKLAQSGLKSGRDKGALLRRERSSSFHKI